MITRFHHKKLISFVFFCRVIRHESGELQLQSTYQSKSFRCVNCKLSHIGKKNPKSRLANCLAEDTLLFTLMSGVGFDIRHIRNYFSFMTAVTLMSCEYPIHRMYNYILLTWPSNQFDSLHFTYKLKSKIPSRPFQLERSSWQHVLWTNYIFTKKQVNFIDLKVDINIWFHRMSSHKKQPRTYQKHSNKICKLKKANRR